MRMAVHIVESRLVTFPLFRPHWQPQEILRPVKSASTAERSLSRTSPVGWDPRDGSSVATCVVETTSWAQASICMYTHQSILGNYCGQDGWQHVYTSTYILSFFPHICGHISVAVTVMTTDSAWTSVFGLSPTHTEEVKLFSVLFSAGSNIIIRPQSSLSPSRCGRQRDVLLTQGSRWIREASALCYGGGDDTTGLWMTLSLSEALCWWRCWLWDRWCCLSLWLYAPSLWLCVCTCLCLPLWVQQS